MEPRLSNGTRVEYHLRKPFKTLAEVKKNSENLSWCTLVGVFGTEIIREKVQDARIIEDFLL